MMKRLIDFFPDLLTEASAGDEAKKRGLKSIGFGRYVDPSNPSKVVAKSKNGKLVSVGSNEKSDIGAAKKQVRDIEKRNKNTKAPSWMKSKEAAAYEKRAGAFGSDNYADRAAGAEKRSRGASAERRGPDRKENQKSLNKRQGNTLRKIFGKGIQLRKVTTAGGQRQMWWDIEDLSQSPSKGLSGAFMSGKGQQWQRNKLAKVKNAIASDPALKGWVPVFQNDPHGGVNLVMVKE